MNDLPICSGGEGGPERCVRDNDSSWGRYIELADRYNRPGEFTTFAAYEFSPTLEGGGKHHRNVIFRGTEAPGPRDLGPRRGQRHRPLAGPRRDLHGRLRLPDDPA